MGNNKLVYSTGPQAIKKCPVCKEFLTQCLCPHDTAGDADKEYKFTALLRLEKSGRKGKTVTVIDGLPKMETFLKDLARELKTRCGAGGTFRMDSRDGIIEIQGDKREAIRALLQKRKYNCKG